MVLRITAGIYKNKRLQSVPGKEFRPLSERIKLALFSILADRIKGSVFLDLCAGTGNVGLEALSRGAECVVFVEKFREKINLIKNNTALLGVEERAEIIQSDVFDFKPQRCFNIIFAGPPYKADISTGILRHINEAGIVNKDTIVIIQHHYKEEVDISGYELIDRRKYGITLIDILTSR